MTKYFKHKKIIAAVLVFAFVLGSVPVYGATKLYEQKQSEIITKGVTYEYSHRLTDAGWQNIHVLNVDPSTDNIKIAPVESSQEVGLKETVLNLLKGTGEDTIAGVNGDFFGLSGNYSASFGLVMDDGELLSAGTDKNIDSNDYATFFMDSAGNPFINFFKFGADFYCGTGYLELASVNKITEMKYPMCITYPTFSDTADIDKRFTGLVKIVVEDEVVSYISDAGETVSVPEDGYVIVLNSQKAEEFLPYVELGKKASLVLSGSYDLTNIETAISGGGTILVDGVEPSYPGTVISGRQPRTAIGVTKDNQIILMVVDGRGESIGATQSEMAALMKEYGAVNAMHLDGGGSSTMVAKTIDDESLEVKNTVSDGSERKVISSLGIFNTSTFKKLSQIRLIPEATRVFTGERVSLDLKGYDEYYNKITILPGQASFSSSEAKGVFSSNVYIPNSAGKVTLTATYAKYTSSADINVMQLVAVEPEKDTLRLSVGESETISLNGISSEGYRAKLSKIPVYEISDSSLGSLNGNVFTAFKEGSGYVKCTVDGKVCYVKFTIGGEKAEIASFANITDVSFSSYPSNVTGSVESTSEGITLKYNTFVSEQTQAAYINFNGFSLGSPSSISIGVTGNATGHWIRGKIKDSLSREYVLDFTRNMDFNDYRELTAEIPSEVSYPITLQTLYVAAIGSQNEAQYSINLKNISGVIPYATPSVPAADPLVDSMQVDLSSISGGSLISVSGTVKSDAAKEKDNYTSARVAVNNTLQQGTDLMIYAGVSDISAESAVDTIKYSEGFASYDKDNVTFITLSASKGTLRLTNASQWLYFKNAALESSDKNIVFLMDKTPAHFSDASEMELFRSALGDIVDSGKNVFVVSSSGTSFWNTIKDGVRYINLPSLWNADGSLNSNFKILNFKATEDKLYYEVKGLS